MDLHLFYFKEDAFLGHEEVKSLSRVLLFVTPWTVAHQAPLSVGFSRQEYPKLQASPLRASLSKGLSRSTRPSVGFGGFYVCFRRPKEIGLISASWGGTTVQICLGCQNQGQLPLSLPRRPLPWLRLGREWAHSRVVYFSSLFSVFLASFFMLG